MASDGEISCTNDPNFAVIYSFLKVFGKLYGLDVPTITKLQELIENTQEVLEPLKDIHLRLLRRALKSVPSNRWDRSLVKFCHQHGHHQEAWEIERFSYKKASTQVKLKVLKLLLEYQFTCHPKFKSAVNALSCKELRLDPIGRDKNGCVYWYQVDDDANLCLFKEDQDEETWQLVARNREEFVKVISQLKNGEEVCPLVTSNSNEDSSSTEVPPQMESQKSGAEEDNEEEFLSPESESDPEGDLPNNDKASDKEEKGTETEQKIKVNEVEVPENVEKVPENEKKQCEQSEKQNVEKIVEEDIVNGKVDEVNEKVDEVSEKVDEVSEKVDEKVEKVNEKVEKVNEKVEKVNENVEKVNEELEVVNSKIDQVTSSAELDRTFSELTQNPESSNSEEVIKSDKVPEDLSEAIEEPVMIVTGEGNGADCESTYIIGEEITEEVMYFFGEGYGYENETGNPEAVEQENSANDNTDTENGEEECVNGEHPHEVSNVSSKTRLAKTMKLKSSLPSVTKRTLKKQNNDNTETLKMESKKQCLRDLDKSDCSISKSDNTLEREGSVNDKATTDSESPKKNNVKKARGKVKKKRIVGNRLKVNDSKNILNSVSENDNVHDSKTNIIEKRKSSISSVDQDEGDHIENEKVKSPEKDTKVEDPLPPKKIRLETPESDASASNSKTVDNVNKSENNEEADEVKAQPEDVENSVSRRKKIKAKKGKFKRKKNLKSNAQGDKVLEKSFDKDTSIKDKKLNKSLKRTLLDATMSDKNKSESQTESEEDEPITIGKRLKVKPKKIITSSRKKVEAKLLEKHSSDESEEETLYSIAGKKSSKKVLKKKPKPIEKGKEKKTSKAQSEDSDLAPVRQSRRIAQQKIKEEAERRHMEEVALREMKMIHKKKSKEDEEEWQASGSSSEGDKKRRPAGTWRAADSTGPDQDSDSDEPLFEIHEEPDLDFTKSDHEFSPESDLESGEPVEPLKRARTLQEGAEDGVCCRCGSGEQPEWILLCDRCDAGYHASCLKPLLLLVPEGDWFCPPCNHDKLISSLEAELKKYDELVTQVEAERARRLLEEPEKKNEDEKEKNGKGEDGDKSQSEGEESSSGWSSSSSGGVYRLRARTQLPVSYRSQEYDRLISSAIKEEYVEPTTSAGNQGRGKDISTIIEAAEEEKMKAEREAIEQGKPVEVKKVRKKARRKPRKLNSLEVPSEDDDETDEDFKDTGMESSSEEISSSAERDSSNDSRSSDSLPIRRTTGRTDKKERPKMTESSPEVKKKKKGVFEDSSSESGGTKEWSNKSETHKKSKSKHRTKRRDKSKKSRKLTQYDAAGNVIRARVTYGGLSDDQPNDWSPKHRTRQKKINYTEMPNTESEDEMHKSSGKHMPDSSDEFKLDDSELSSSGSDSGKRKPSDEERQRALCDLIKKTAVVPLEKLPEDVTKAKTEELEELQAQIQAQQAAAAAAAVGARGRGGRGGRARGRGRGGGRARGHRGASPATDTDDALAKLVGVKIKDLKADGPPMRPNEIEREKKRQEREAKQAEKEARRLERLQKKEEKEKLKEQKAKEREEKRLARLALQESKRIKKEKQEYPMGPIAPIGYGPRGPVGPPHEGPRPPFPGPGHPADFREQRFPQQPRLQVRAELRGMVADERHAIRDGTLSVAGSPQPFKPITEEPSIITRMPHMINQQYRGPMMYSPGNSPYGPRAQNMQMYPLHPGMNPQNRHQYPQGYYPPHLRGMPPSYPAGMRPPGAGPVPPTGGGPHGPPANSPHGPPANSPHGPPVAVSGQHGPPVSSPHGMPGPYHGQLRPNLGLHGPLGAMGPHGPHRPMSHNSPGPSPLAGPPSSLAHAMSSGGVISGPRGMPPHGPHIAGPAGHPPGPVSGPPGPTPGPPGPTPTPPSGPPGTPTPTNISTDLPIKIKAEVKTEPEYRTPPSSPRPPSPRDEPPRHPKIKHTENKDRRPRYPLGPYAPQYGPYGPYAPPGAGPPAPDHAPLMNLPPRPPGQHPLQRMQQIHRLLPANAAEERAGSPGPRPPLERPEHPYLSALTRAPPRPPYAPRAPPPYGPPYAEPHLLPKQGPAPTLRERLEGPSPPVDSPRPTSREPTPLSAPPSLSNSSGTPTPLSNSPSPMSNMPIPVRLPLATNMPPMSNAPVLQNTPTPITTTPTVLPNMPTPMSGAPTLRPNAPTPPSNSQTVLSSMPTPISNSQTVLSNMPPRMTGPPTVLQNMPIRMSSAPTLLQHMHTPMSGMTQLSNMPTPLSSMEAALSNMPRPLSSMPSAMPTVPTPLVNAAPRVPTVQMPLSSATSDHSEQELEQPPSPVETKPIPEYLKMEEIVNKDRLPLHSIIKQEECELPPREEGSVFGGLVSYFSSQREDDIDA